MAWELGEGDFLAEERIQTIIGEKTDRCLEPPAESPAGSAFGRHGADLTRYQTQAPGVKRAAER